MMGNILGYIQSPLLVVVFVIPIFLIVQRKIQALFACIFICLGFINYLKYFEVKADSLIHSLGSEIDLVCEVTVHPNIGKFYSTFIANCEGNEAKANVYFQVSKYKELKKFSIFTSKCKLEIPQNEGEFDFIDYLKTKNTFITCKPTQINILGFNESSIFSKLENFKTELKKRISQIFPQPHAALLSGITIGDIEGMTIDFEEALSQTSTTHIVAVSGFNVTLLLNFCMGFTWLIPKKKAILLSAVLITLFIFLVGLDNIPALRATLIGYTLILSKLIGRKNVFIPALFLSAALLFCFNPYVFKDLSFQLSFASTMGLYLLTPYLTERFNFLPEFIKDNFTTSLAATMATLPIILFFFNRLSILGIFVNILVLPFIPISMILGIGIFPLIFLIPEHGLIFSYPVFILLDLIIEIIKKTSLIPFATIEVENGFLALIIVLVIFLFIITFVIPKKDEISLKS